MTNKLEELKESEGAEVKKVFGVSPFENFTVGGMLNTPGSS